MNRVKWTKDCNRWLQAKELEVNQIPAEEMSGEAVRGWGDQQTLDGGGKAHCNVPSVISVQWQARGRMLKLETAGHWASSHCSFCFMCGFHQIEGPL